MSRFIFVLLLLPVCAFAQPANQKLSERPLFESEPFIAMDPVRPQYICAAWMSGRAIGGHPVTIVTRFSTDGGTTWSAPQDMPHMANGWQSADVSMVWPSSDPLYVCYIDYLDNSSDSGGVFVARSRDHGLTWTEPVRAIDVHENSYISLDRPWIAAGSSKDLVIATKPASWHPLPNHTFITYSGDAGASWSPEIVVDTAPFPADFIRAPMGSPVEAGRAPGIAYPFLDTKTLKGGFALALYATDLHLFQREFITQPIPSHDTLFKGGFRLLLDPVRRNKFGGAQLAFVWPDARNGDIDIYCTITGDSGAGGSWGVPFRINDDPIGNGVMQDMVWPTYASDGTLVVVWRDRRNGTGSGYASASDTYYAYSRDGGKTFSKNFRLSDSTAQYEKVLDNPGNDFMSVVATHDSLYAVWADTRTGGVQVYFAKAALGSTSWVGEQSLSSNNIALSCYPNPATTSCTVEYMLDKPSHCSLNIVNEEGAVFKALAANESIGKQSHTLDLTGLASGNYLIQLRTEAGVSHTRLSIR